MHPVRRDLGYSIGIPGSVICSTQSHRIHQRAYMAATGMQLVSLENDDLGKKSKREGDELRL